MLNLKTSMFYLADFLQQRKKDDGEDRLYLAKEIHYHSYLSKIKTTMISSQE